MTVNAMDTTELIAIFFGVPLLFALKAAAIRRRLPERFAQWFVARVYVKSSAPTKTKETT